MKILRLTSLKNWPKASAVTIGNFDGGHRGHQALLSQLRDCACGQPTVVVSFEPSSREFFAQKQGATIPARLSNFQEKAAFFEKQKIDYWLCLPFTRIVDWSAEKFVETIVQQGLAAQLLVLGEDFHFGKDRRGNIDFLKKQLPSTVRILRAETVCTADGLRISSSRLRQALALPDLPLAETLLGHPYKVFGRVEQGQQLGRRLGFPTANLALKRQVAPLRGVFVVQVDFCQGKQSPKKPASAYFGLANLGLRPTVNGQALRLEVHLFGFRGDLYGQKLQVTFLHFLRPEQRFPHLEALTAAIQADKAAAEAWLSQQNQNHGL
jgi:riboflavin kinase/FMN adenylyltransferase